MIRQVRRGVYRLIETKGYTKILLLNNVKYAWIFARPIGQILVKTRNPYETGALLGAGEFRMYEVEDEEELTDQRHLELRVGEDEWQGYLLPSGLPTTNKVRVRIIPTNELVSAHRV